MEMSIKKTVFPPNKPSDLDRTAVWADEFLAAAQPLGWVRLFTQKAGALVETFIDVRALRVADGWAHYVTDRGHLHLDLRELGQAMVASSSRGDRPPYIAFYNRTGVLLFLWVADAAPCQAAQQRTVLRKLVLQFGTNPILLCDPTERPPNRRC